MFQICNNCGQDSTRVRFRMLANASARYPAKSCIKCKDIALTDETLVAKAGRRDRSHEGAFVELYHENIAGRLYSVFVLAPAYCG